LWVVPVADEVRLESMRFGRVALVPGQITRLNRLAQVRPLDAPDADDEPGVTIPSTPAPPRCELVGDSHIAGAIDVDALEVRNHKGERTVKMSAVQSLERDPEAGLNPLFHITLRSGEKVTGHLGRMSLPVRSDRHVWSIPADHLVLYEAASRSGDAAAAAGAPEAPPASVRLRIEPSHAARPAGPPDRPAIPGRSQP